jgi:hypothetical protein
LLSQTAEPAAAPGQANARAASAGASADIAMILKRRTRERFGRCESGRKSADHRQFVIVDGG